MQSLHCFSTLVWPIIGRTSSWVHLFPLVCTCFSVLYLLVIAVKTKIAKKSENKESNWVSMKPESRFWKRKFHQKDRGTSWAAAVIFAALIGGCFAYVVTNAPTPIVLSCPNECLGLVTIEGPNDFETVNLKTGRHREWRFRADPPLTPNVLFAGYVIEMTFIEHGDYELPDANNYAFHIVRGKELKRPAYYPLLPVTYFDGPDRPVLAKNCYNTPDDKSVVCDGGIPEFGIQLSEVK